MTTTTPTPLLRQDDLRVELLRGTGAERQRCEQDLAEFGVPLPLPHRCAWAGYRQAADSWFVAVKDVEGRCRAGFAVEVNRSRALPGHVILRAERFGHSVPEPLRGVCVAALERLARGNRRVLRVHVEVFSPDPAAREGLAASLRARRFQPLAGEIRGYRNTLVIDLRPDEAGILASFHATARRHIRAAGKHPVALRPIEDAALAPRMKELVRETRERTNGPLRDLPWAAVMDLSRQSPEHSRLVGLFRTDVGGPYSLLAFAWGCGHGDHAHYETAASTRPADLRLPLSYVLVWDLVCWAKQNGASWFDFGGITAGHHGSEDGLGGVSDFKRYFSKDLVPVGEEWLLEPGWLRAKLAQAVSGCVGWLTTFRRGG